MMVMPNMMKTRLSYRQEPLTDQDGEFSLFVKPDTYNIVAYIDGKEFDYETIQTYPDDVIDGVDFELLEATTKGTIEGKFQ